MDRFVCRFGWILGVALCVALVAIPLQAVAAEQGETTKEKAEAEKPPVKESELVRAANAAKKKRSDAITYTNDDLQEGESPRLTYTNEDLSRMFGSSEEAPTKGTAARSGAPAATAGGTEDYDPLAAMERQQQNQASRQQKIDAAEGALAAAQAKLKSLEVQLLATKNPFSARPQLSEEEQAERAISGETALERNQRTQKAVDEARAEVAEAEANLSRARSE